MLALWMFGCDLERRWGTQFFLKYYFVTVIGGAILNVIFLPGQLGPSIGASAGVYGLLLAYGLIYPDRIVYFYFLFPIKMKHFVWIIGAIAVYSSVTSGESGIAHLAHLGGMVFGYIYLRGGHQSLGPIQNLPRPPPSQSPEKTLPSLPWRQRRRPRADGALTNREADISEVLFAALHLLPRNQKHADNHQHRRADFSRREFLDIFEE